MEQRSTLLLHAPAAPSRTDDAEVGLFEVGLNGRTGRLLVAVGHGADVDAVELADPGGDAIAVNSRSS